MPDDASHLGVDQLLRYGRAHLRVLLVVLGHERELGVLTIDLDVGGVGFLDGEPRAVLIVLAEMRIAPGERRDVADLDFEGTRAGLRGRAFRFLRPLLRRLLATAANHKRDREERNGELRVLHRILRGA